MSGPASTVNDCQRSRPPARPAEHRERRRHRALYYRGPTEEPPCRHATIASRCSIATCGSPRSAAQVTPAMVEDVRAFWRDLGLDLDAPARARRRRHAGAVGRDPRARRARRPSCSTATTTSSPPAISTRWRWEGVACQPFEPTYFHGGRPVDPRTLDDRALDDVTVVARGGADNKGQHLSQHPGRARRRAGRPRALARARSSSTARRSTAARTSTPSPAPTASAWPPTC